MEYILYESLNDTCMEFRDLQLNTNILGVYDNEEKALEEYDKILNDTIMQNSIEYDWYSENVDLNILENKNIIKADYIMNDSLKKDKGKYYLLMLEKKEVNKND